MLTKTYRGATLDYATVYPPGYAAGVPLPVAFGLHGFGADKYDLTGLAEALTPDGGVLWVFPDAPQFAFDGADPTARAWYERGGDEGPESVRLATDALDGLVREVLDRYRPPPGRAVLLGFSQGGAVALRYGLPRPDAFAGVAALSNSLRRLDDLTPLLPAGRDQHVFIGHGTLDQVVPRAWSDRLAEFLRGHGYRPRYRTYRAGHHISPEEAADLRAWLAALLPG